MIDQLTKRLKGIEEEILRLKNAKEYASVKNSFSQEVSVSTGIYKVTYSNNNQQVLSEFFSSLVDNDYIVIGARPVSGNEQILEVQTSYWSNQDQEVITTTVSLIAVANYPIVSITRIS